MISFFTLFSFLLSSLLTFYTIVFLVHACMYFSRLSDYRLRYFLRFIPLAAIILDSLAFKFGISNWLNPFSCTSCTQKFFLKLFFPDLHAFLHTHQISLTSYLSSQEPYYLGIFFLIILGSVSFFLLCRKVLAFFYHYRSLKVLCTNVSILDRPIKNHHLALLVKNHHCKILVSEKILVPMALPNNCMILPGTMVTQLNDEEFDAVIAHEWEHIRWKDPLLKILLNLFSALFFWIPLKSWIKKIEHEQEMGCDQAIARLQLDYESLASALLQVAVQAKNKVNETICYLANKEKILFKRIKALLNFYPKERFTLLGFCIIFLGLFFSVVCAFI